METPLGEELGRRLENLGPPLGGRCSHPRETTR